MKIKINKEILKLLLISLLILSFQQASANTLDLSSLNQPGVATIDLEIDKNIYKVGETLQVHIDILPERPLKGQIEILEVINEKKTSFYYSLFSTVPSKNCYHGGITEIISPFSDTFSRQMIDPGNYCVVANFRGVEKKVYFTVLGDEEEAKKEEIPDDEQENDVFKDDTEKYTGTNSNTYILENELETVTLEEIREDEGEEVTSEESQEDDINVDTSCEIVTTGSIMANVQEKSLLRNARDYNSEIKTDNEIKQDNEVTLVVGTAPDEKDTGFSIEKGFTLLFLFLMVIVSFVVLVVLILAFVRTLNLTDR